MGKALGRVRDADARIDLLRYMESRIPAAASLARLRQQQERDRLQRLRKLVKRLERLGIEKDIGRSATPAIWPRGRRWLAASGAWRDELRHVVDQRAREAADAIADATAVYFPNRAHRARIALKKFRYAAEIGAQTGAPIGERLLRMLKKGQDELGGLHDREALLDELRAAGEHPSDSADDARERQAIVHFAEAEIADLHRGFVAHRSRLLEATDEACKAMRRSHIPATTLAAATAVACAGLFAIRRKARVDAEPKALPVPTSEPVSSGAVSVRVPVVVAFDSER
jgi:CHAD domain-containing protein